MSHDLHTQTEGVKLNLKGTYTGQYILSLWVRHSAPPTSQP